MSKVQKPLVSVRLMVYNNEPYIREAVESILRQKTSFKVEIVVGDDFSTDNTLDIIKSYECTENVYFNILDRPIGGEYWKDRQRLGRLYNFKNIIDNCQGKYIALLDGDDYWTDVLKLQKQVDFLEENQDFAICFHNVIEYNTFDGSKKLLPDCKENRIYSIEDYIINNLTASCSIMFKKNVIGHELPKWFIKSPFGDLAIVLMVLKESNSKAMVLSGEMGFYRIHANGIHGKLYKNKKEFRKAFYQHLKFTRKIAKELLFDSQYRPVLYTKKKNSALKISKFNKQYNYHISGFYYKMLSKYYNYKSKQYL